MLSLPAQIKQCTRLTGRIVLRSGKVSDTDFDKYQFEADPLLLKAIALEMAALVPPGTEVLAGLEMGGIPIVTLLSQITGLPAAFIRKEAKEYENSRYSEGAPLSGKRFILVEDVVSSGGTLIDAVAKLKADGLVPTEVMCVINRETGATEALSAVGLNLKALFTFTQIKAG